MRCIEVVTDIVPANCKVGKGFAHEENMDFILAIDQGTTSTTALIIDKSGRIIAEGSNEFPQHFPKEGYVEHWGNEIQISVEKACLQAIALAKISPTSIAGLGITNQRETVCWFTKKSESIRPFIVWQCRRSTAICEELKKKDLNEFFHKKTGLHLDPYFSGSKMLWQFRNDKDLLHMAQTGEALFGTIDTFLCHWMSGGKLHITDTTNASRTMLMDISTGEFNDECLDIFSVPKACLPRIEKSTGPYGKTHGLSFLPDGIPIAAIAGDQQAALFGQQCFSKGDAKTTFGTGCFILLNTGDELIFSRNGLLTSVGYHIDDKPVYCLEGSAFIAGAAIQFLRDAFGIISSSTEIEPLAKTVADSGGVIFVPALCGLGAPHWRPQARGVFSGLSRGTMKGHIARATLEGIALQNTDILEAMAKDGVKPLSLKIDGGAAKNDLLMQMHSDLLGIPCLRPGTSQKTALGAAYLAGLALGIFSSTDDIRKIEEPCRSFTPHNDRSWANDLIARYQHEVARA